MGMLKVWSFLSWPEVKFLCLALMGFAVSVCQLSGAKSTEPLGFISIDCGLSDKSMNYSDSATANITYVSDVGFIDEGTNANISSRYISNSMAKQLQSVRSFPSETRNCYTVINVAAKTKYLVRGMFLYGNYDGLNSTQILFDLYLGVNLWKTMNITDPASVYRAEVVTSSTAAGFMQVCLVNTGQGTPFISALELRRLGDVPYPQVNDTRSLVLKWRFNVGPSNILLRYPDDSLDRIWEPLSNAALWKEISSDSTIVNDWYYDYYEGPSKVMQTASVPMNSAQLLFSWQHQQGDINEYYLIPYFSELQKLSSNMTRQFYLKLNGVLWYPDPFSPEYLYSEYFYSLNPELSFSIYNFTIEATSNSTLPPLLNAIEVYTTMRNENVPSDIADVNAMMGIKASYQIKMNWMGDPCSPQDYSWDGVTCNYTLNSLPRITALNLSSSGLIGEITTSFGSLHAIRSLDLSYNNLSGTIPDILGQLSLTLLDLTGNQLNGTIPSNLLAKSQEGTLTLRTGGNNLLCSTESSCEAIPSSSKKMKTSVIVIISVVAVAIILVAAFIIYKLRYLKGSGKDTSIQPQYEDFPFQTWEHPDDSLQLENRQFTYLDLKRITNNFEIELGNGGFGRVYYGSLEDGTQVAVKLLSQSSTQGSKEFLAEARHLTRVHHKNLVSMVGYCKDRENLALVYEYMSQGTLQQHLRGRKPSDSPLSWRQRLRIAVDAAQGLEYLHKGCKPSLIHRDVKSSNILLSEKFEAKMADFGLSKPFQHDKSHVSTTAIMGTPGYLDPDYYTNYRLSEKSDVFSFGVVLLELITAQPPLVNDDVHVVQWVRQSLAKGNMEDIIDNKMLGNYDLNSVWKCSDIALKCTSISSHQRPAMTDVVMQLKDCLELQIANDANENLTTSENLHTDTGDSSENSALEIEDMAIMAIVDFPSLR